MKHKMSVSSRREYLLSIYGRYRKSSKQEKVKVLNEFCGNTKYNRKYALRLLNSPLRKTPKTRKVRGVEYTNEHVYYLTKVWEVLDYPCGQRLQSVLPEMITVLRRHKELRISDRMAEKISEMSAKTIDRKLSKKKLNLKRKLLGTTKPGSLLKRHIPIELSRWDEKRPGFCELDMVAHCGNSASGDFCLTLNITDLATGWTEEESVLGKAQERVKSALDHAKDRLPFRLRGIDPDNGSEFINWQLYRYCLERKIKFTRGRPGKKNDNAHIEQKNWTHVRKIVGYVRLQTQEEADVLNELYRGPLRLYMNFFQPVMKLVKKERVGGRLCRKYDKPMTPYQRVLKSRSVPKEKKQGLQKVYETFNPVKLKKEIETLLDKLQKIVDKRRRQKQQ